MSARNVYFFCSTLRESFRIRSFLVRISNQTEHGEIRSICSYSVQMRENMGKKNSKYGHFSRSATLSSGHEILSRLHLKDCQRQ